MSIVANSRMRSRPVGSDWIFPPPVALPDVFGGPGGQPAGGLVSQGVKSTLLSGSMILSPRPVGLLGFEGPDGLPHQLFSAFSCGVVGYANRSTSIPARMFPWIQFW